MLLLDLVSGDPNTLLKLTRRQVAGLVIEILNSGPDAGGAEFDLHNFCLYEFAGHNANAGEKLHQLPERKYVARNPKLINYEGRNEL